MGPIFRDVIRALVAVSALLPFSAAVPMGLQIYSCTMPGVIAPGFDDGPWIYSEDILDRYVIFQCTLKQSLILL